MKLITQFKFKKENILIIATFFGTALKITGKRHYPRATCSSTIKQKSFAGSKTITEPHCEQR